jgi:predicted MFS family arabinose efflux permease
LAVPGVLAAHASEPHGWAWAWWWLALACGLATAALVWPAQFFKKKEAAALVGINLSATKNSSSAPTVFPPPSPADTHPTGHWVRRLGFAMAGYACFGVGYIGYMTFVIALLREQGMAPADVTLFYALLGAAVVASGRLWAGLLDRAKGGGALALLNALLGVATVLPAVTTVWPLLLLSGVMFGGVFLSVVASTTALVRHNLPVAQWPAGISAFTIVFAAGQILGPSGVGWIADGPGGLARGLLCSALALWLGAVFAWRQRSLTLPARTLP